MKQDDFLMEIQQKLMEIDEIIDKYEMRDQLMSIFVVGVLEPYTDTKSTMKTMYGYSLDSEEELDTIIDFIKETWKEQKDIGGDLDDLLNGLGISLN
jgi:hypothetical protein